MLSRDEVDPTPAVTALRASANPARLRILFALLPGERSVGSLEVALRLRQPGLSQHLATLREAGLIAPRREAKSVYYRIAGQRQRRLIAALRDNLTGDETVIGPARPRGRQPSRNQQAAVFAVTSDRSPQSAAEPL